MNTPHHNHLQTDELAWPEARRLARRVLHRALTSDDAAVRLVAARVVLGLPAVANEGDAGLDNDGGPMTAM